MEGRSLMLALFVYGTLQDADVQMMLLGRTIVAELDALSGYVINWEYFAPYPVAISADNSHIEGQVLYITEEELEQLDQYEGDAYIRVQVWLDSGIQAWVYIANPLYLPPSQLEQTDAI